jgi:hypothetical protein
MPAHTARSFLTTTPTLQSLMQQAQKLLALQEVWQQVAPQSLTASSSVGTLRDRTLVVYASNGATAAKLRQLLPSLLEKIQKRGIEVTAIRVDVQVDVPHINNKQKDLAVSDKALESLSQLENSLEDSPLKEALQTMIRHHSHPVKD